ncbi:MAG: hypothetical protein QM728_14880 [Gordonia sp. (in: high G+C Gram-positive bacteria)]|uniref:hypothetical protein n=1 Tax=Gordonia sp. (in: high G+C Gram-positive bacteria) TaxID=84139 RepID=UPI0039E61F37
MSEASRVFPEPPFAPELIADLHAGVLDDDLAAHVRSRLPEDPQAAETLAALEATVSALHGAPAPEVEVSPELRAASEATLASLESDDAPTAPIPAPSRGRRFSAAWLIAAAVAGVLIGGAAVAALMAPGRPASPDAGEPVATGDAANLLAAARAPQTEAMDANRLARCLTANGMGGAAIVGAGYLDYRGRPAQVILTPAGKAGKFTALVTTRDCDAGKPHTIARTTVGD